MSDVETGDLPRVRSRVVVAVLAAVVVGLLVVSGYLGWQVRAAAATDRDRQDAVTAAKQEAVNLTSQDYTTIKADVDRMLAGATGDLRTDLAAQRQRYSDTFVQNKLKASGSASDAGLVTMRGSSATVIVVIDQTVQSGAQGKQNVSQTRRYRLELDMSHIGGKWLAANLRAAGLVS